MVQNEVVGGEKEPEEVFMDINDGEVDEDDDSFEFDLPKANDPDEDSDLGPKAELLKQGSTVSRVTQKFSRSTTLRVTEVYTKDSFQIVKSLGSGAYGTVFLVKKKGTENLFAMKEL